MSPVRRSKCIVHIKRSHRRQLRSKITIALLLLLVKTQIFQQHHLARLQTAR